MFSILFIMPFLFIVDCFLPAAKKYAALCCHSNCVYDVENAHCAVDFGHSVGKCICIFICIFICLTNLWPTLNCPLSRCLPPSSRSLAHSLHCHGTPTHPLSLILLVALCAQVWNYFKYSPEHLLHLPRRTAPRRHLPSCRFCLRKHRHFVYTESTRKWKKKMKNQICWGNEHSTNLLFCPLTQIEMIFFFSPHILIWRKSKRLVQNFRLA